MAIPVGPNFDWNAYRLNGGSTTPQPGSPNWNAMMQQQQQQQMAEFQNQMRQIQQQYPVPQFNPSPNPAGSSARGGDSSRGGVAGGAGVAAGGYGDPNLDALVAQLRQQAGEADSTLNDRATRQIEAQRAVADRNINQMLQKSLAASGVLPTGGLAARFRDEIAKPIDERLNAYAADVQAGLRNERTSSANNLLQQLTSLSNQRNQGLLDERRFQLDQQRLSAELAAQQQRMALAQQEAMFNRQQSAFEAAMRNAALSSQMPAVRSGNGGSVANQGGGTPYDGLPMTGSITGWADGVNTFLSQGRQPRDVYNDMIRGTDQRTRDYNSVGNQALRLEQQQRAMQANPNSYNGAQSAAGMIPSYSGMNGSGIGLGGSATNISFGGGLSSAGSPTGISFGGISAANMGPIGGGYSYGMGGQGGYGGGGNNYGNAGAAAAGMIPSYGQTYGGMPAGYGRSMY